MKPQNSSKWIPFVIGLGIGSALTVAFILYSKKQSDTGSNKPGNIVSETEKKTKNDFSKKDSSQKSKTVAYARKGNQEEEYPHLEEKTEWYDSLKNTISNTSENDVETVVPLGNNENDPVITETLLSVKSFKVIALDKLNPPTEKDSTIERLNQVKPSTLPKEIEVEYWKSPLNSKGYKAGRKKIALYGMDIEQPLFFFYKVDRLLLYTGKDFYYFLDVSPEFKSFKKQTDPQVLEDIQKKLD